MPTPTQWNTIHAFSYGEVQMIGEDYNVKFPTTKVTTLPAVLADILAKKPAGNNADADYFRVTVFNNMQASYDPNNAPGSFISFG